MTAASAVLAVLLALAVAILASVALFAASGALSPRRPRGSATGLGKSPFTGGVPLPSQRYRYYTDLVAMISFFLLAEGLAIFLLFSPSGLEVLAFALFGLGGVLVSAVLFQRARVRSRGSGARGPQ